VPSCQAFNSENFHEQRNPINLNDLRYDLNRKVSTIVVMAEIMTPKDALDFRDFSRSTPRKPAVKHLFQNLL
jgi:hypothetical protein